LRLFQVGTRKEYKETRGLGTRLGLQGVFFYDFLQNGTSESLYARRKRTTGRKKSLYRKWYREWDKRIREWTARTTRTVTKNRNKKYYVWKRISTKHSKEKTFLWFPKEIGLKNRQEIVVETNVEGKEISDSLM
jgi:hypothetical protein